MQYSALNVLALASSVLASPVAKPPTNVPGFNEPFGVLANGPGISQVNLAAANGRIYVGGPQYATCDDGTPADYATFAYYSDNTISLWHTEPPYQELWVDASGMGQGATGYTTGNSSAPASASRSSFAIDSTGLIGFNGVGAKACPTASQGVYSVWFTTLDSPGNQAGCVPISLQAYKAPARPSCLYN